VASTSQKSCLCLPSIGITDIAYIQLFTWIRDPVLSAALVPVHRSLRPPPVSEDDYHTTGFPQAPASTRVTQWDSSGTITKSRVKLYLLTLSLENIIHTQYKTLCIKHTFQRVCVREWDGERAFISCLFCLRSQHEHDC